MHTVIDQAFTKNGLLMGEISKDLIKFAQSESSCKEEYAKRKKRLEKL
jgi:hypothetical protein